MAFRFFVEASLRGGEGMPGISLLYTSRSNSVALFREIHSMIHPNNFLRFVSCYLFLSQIISSEIYCINHCNPTMNQVTPLLPTPAPYLHDGFQMQIARLLLAMSGEAQFWSKHGILVSRKSAFHLIISDPLILMYFMVSLHSFDAIQIGEAM